MKKIITLCLVFMLFIAYAAWADEVFVQDGSRYTGRIVAEDTESVTLQTKEGKLFLLRSDIVHIERREEGVDTEDIEEERGFFTRWIDTIKSLPNNNWHVPRQKLNTIHNIIFTYLGRNRIYQYVANKPSISKFRRENTNSYNFAVYMVLFIIVTVVIVLVKNIMLSVIRKIFGIKERFDI